MKWIRFEYQGRPCFGVLEETRVVPTDQDWSGILRGRRGFRREAAVPLADQKLLPPVPTPGKILAVGQNYLDHCREQGKQPPEHPLIFAKLPSSMIAAGETICWSASLTRQVDFEAELAVVIGRTCRQAPEGQALSYVLGYTAANDVSARDLQYGDRQWTRGKGLDTFCPLGPALVEAADVPDPQDLAIRSRVNGQVMQDSRTSQMIFPIPRLIAYCSEAFTLQPGDLLLTGTPHGVGVWRTPPVFLGDGDVVAIEIEGIGTLENPCRVA